MKPYLYLSAALLLAITMWACNSSKVPSEKELAKEQNIREKVEQKDFSIEVTQANPMRGKSINLSFGYDLKMKNDSVYAYLPYYGVAHSAPYGGDGGIKFATLMTDYTLFPIKDGWDIRFKANTREYNYDVLLNVFKNGSSTISVTTYQRDPISFYGRIIE